MKKLSNLTTKMQACFTNAESTLSQITKDFSEINSRMEKAEGNIKNINTDLTYVNNRIEALESVTNSTNTKNESADFILQEFEDRRRRKTKFLIFGLSEPHNEKNVYNFELDKSGVLKLIQSLFTESSIAYNQLKIFRLGKISHARIHPRPVKVVCSSEDHVLSILSKVKEVKAANSQNLEALSFAPDRTIRQQQEYKDLTRVIEE